MQKVQNRLKRIEGQIRGLQKMIAETPEDCEKIIIQFLATKSAIESCFSEILSGNLKKCLNGENSEKMQKILALLFKNSK